MRFLVKKSNIIIIDSYNPFVYSDNTKYLYEYLSDNTDYDIYWITKNAKVVEFLQKKNLKSLNIKKVSTYLFSLYLLLKAKIIINCGTKYFNPLNIKLLNTIKITTFHGNGPKTVITPNMNESDILDINMFDYINFTSDSLIKSCGKAFQIPKKKLIKFGYPRCDQFFNYNYVKTRHEQKKIARIITNGKISKKSKIILYTPTWRPYTYDFPLFSLKGLKNFKLLDDYLNEKNYFFFYSIHTAFNIPRNIPTSKRIILIDNTNKHPFYDTNRFMLEVDLLVNDYSTTSTDFALLKRPQLFFMPDFDRYQKEKGFLEDYKSSMPGKEFENFSDFKKFTNEYLSDKNNYEKEYKAKINNYLNKYYDLDSGNSAKMFSAFIETLM